MTGATSTTSTPDFFKARIHVEAAIWDGVIIRLDNKGFDRKVTNISYVKFFASY